MKTKQVAQQQRQTIEQQLDEFFGRGGEVVAMGTTQLKPQKFVIDGTKLPTQRQIKPYSA